MNKECICIEENDCRGLCNCSCHSVTVEEKIKDQQQKTYVTPLEEQRAVVGYKDCCEKCVGMGFEPCINYSCECHITSASNGIEEAESKIYELVGEASMAWHLVPLGTFDSAKAVRISKDIIGLLHAVADKARTSELLSSRTAQSGFEAALGEIEKGADNLIVNLKDEGSIIYHADLQSFLTSLKKKQ